MKIKQRITPVPLERFSHAVTTLDQPFATDTKIMVDENQDATLRG